MKEILSITGRPGLYKFVSQGRNAIIVETLTPEQKRLAVGGREQITALGDISIYTEGEDKPLAEVFASLAAVHSNKPVEINIKTASSAQLSELLTAALPDYDRERVHTSDIRKLIQWYNLLTEAGVPFATAEELSAES